jgi:hypothetical protein
MKRKVIHKKNLPVHLPLSLTIALYLLLDRSNAPGWVWGALGVLLLLDRSNAPGWVWGALGVLLLVWWIASFIVFFKQEEVDILKDK